MHGYQVLENLWKLQCHSLYFYDKAVYGPFCLPCIFYTQYQMEWNGGTSWLSLSRTRKGPENLFEIERVRDRERKIGYSLHKGTPIK